jgi:hypothetical protein
MFLILLLFFTGITLIILNQNINNNNTQPQIVRLIPKSLNEEIDNPHHASDTFRTMFYNPSPWINMTSSYRLQKRENLNQHFLTEY